MNTEIKSADKFYNYFKEELLVKCDRILRDKGLSSVASSDCISMAMDDLKKLFDEYHVQFKQPDISEDVRKAAEKYLTDLGIANTGMFTSRTMLKTFEAGAEWQSQQPIPTVDEDEYNRGYQDGYNKAASEAIEEIHKNYSPNSITRK